MYTPISHSSGSGKLDGRGNIPLQAAELNLWVMRIAPLSALTNTEQRTIKEAIELHVNTLVEVYYYLRDKIST